MPLPDMAVLAEGGLPTGQRWVLRAGGTERGMRRVLVRADPRVARVRVHLGSGEQLDLPPVAVRPDLGLAFFAALLPPSAVMVSVAAIDENEQVLEPQDLSHHEANWQRFLQQHGHPGP